MEPFTNESKEVSLRFIFFKGTNKEIYLFLGSECMQKHKNKNFSIKNW